MTEIIPLFPLKLVCFPGESLNLHIFEERYKNLINDVQSNNQNFGIPPVQDEALYPIGSEIELMTIAHTYHDGKLDIKTRCLRKFHILRIVDEGTPTSYMQAEVEYLEDNSKGDQHLQQECLDRVAKLYDIMRIDQEVPQWSPTFKLASIIHKIGLNYEQELEMFELATENDRLRYAINHLENVLPMVKEMEEMRKKVEMNGHFKHFDPPQL